MKKLNDYPLMWCIIDVILALCIMVDFIKFLCGVQLTNFIIGSYILLTAFVMVICALDRYLEYVQDKINKSN